VGLRVPAEDHHHRRLCQTVHMGGRLAGVDPRCIQPRAPLPCSDSLPPPFSCAHTASQHSASSQVGNETVDQSSWTRPEDITTPRSFYYNKLALNGASDLNGQIVGALASTAAVFKTKQPSLYDKYMNVALPLYGMAIGAQFTGHPSSASFCDALCQQCRESPLGAQGLLDYQCQPGSLCVLA
jgi:Glycosyl hydrolase family 9